MFPGRIPKDGPHRGRHTRIPRRWHVWASTLRGSETRVVDSRISQKELAKLMRLARTELVVADRRPKMRGAAICCGWLALLGLVLAMATASGPWHTIGLSVFAVFLGCALRLLQLLCLRVEDRPRQGTPHAGRSTKPL
jgi:hypothetical protein